LSDQDARRLKTEIFCAFSDLSLHIFLWQNSTGSLLGAHTGGFDQARTRRGYTPISLVRMTRTHAPGPLCAEKLCEHGQRRPSRRLFTLSKPSRDRLELERERDLSAETADLSYHSGCMLRILRAGKSKLCASSRRNFLSDPRGKHVGSGSLDPQNYDRRGCQRILAPCRFRCHGAPIGQPPRRFKVASTGFPPAPCRRRPLKSLNRRWRP